MHKIFEACLLCVFNDHPHCLIKRLKFDVFSNLNAHFLVVYGSFLCCLHCRSVQLIYQGQTGCFLAKFLFIFMRTIRMCNIMQVHKIRMMASSSNFRSSPRRTSNRSWRTPKRRSTSFRAASCHLQYCLCSKFEFRIGLLKSGQSG